MDTGPVVERRELDALAQRYSAVSVVPPAARAPLAVSGFLWPEDRPGEHAAPTDDAGESAQDTPGWKAWAQRAVAIAGVTLAIGFYLAPLPAGLTAAGKASAAVFILCTTLWVTNAIPIGITGLVAIGLLGLTGAMAPADAFAAFGNSAVFFIIGVFIL